MQTTHTRKPLRQQAEPEKKGPFFGKANDEVKKKDEVFFQTKLSVSEPGDKHEQEADSIADKVQRKSEEQKEEKAVQKKGKEEEKPVQQMSGTDKQDEDRTKASKKEDDKKEKISKKESTAEGKPVQNMSSNNKQEDKTALSRKEHPAATTVMAKEAGGAQPAAHPVSVEKRIARSKGKGHSLPDDVRNFLEGQLGADFAEVVIHTDNEAIALAADLGALAFTTGYDIYFNAGQYQPDTLAGQKLLAHELTHVIQQTGVSKRDNKK